MTLVIFLPAVGMAIILLLPKAEETAAKVVALVTTLVTLGVGIGIAFDFNYSHSAQLQFVANEPWIDVIKARYHIGLDGISLPMLILSMVDHGPVHHLLLEPLARSRTTRRRFLALILLLEVGMNGTFVAQDLILFFIFFEIVLLPMFFMIGVWGGPEPRVRVDQVLPLHACSAPR